MPGGSGRSCSELRGSPKRGDEEEQAKETTEGRSREVGEKPSVYSITEAN